MEIRLISVSPQGDREELGMAKTIEAYTAKRASGYIVTTEDEHGRTVRVNLTEQEDGSLVKQYPNGYSIIGIVDEEVEEVEDGSFSMTLSGVPMLCQIVERHDEPDADPESGEYNLAPFADIRCHATDGDEVVETHISFNEAKRLGLV